MIPVRWARSPCGRGHRGCIGRERWLEQVRNRRCSKGLMKQYDLQDCSRVQE
ncbi:stress-activated map kinase-interacting protein 1, partial [Moniliophthora roreri]